jgi:hypothetical protein
MASEPSLFTTHFDWTYFISLSCEEGRRWTEEFRTEPCAVVEEQIQRSLDLLRQHRVDEGFEVLCRVEESLSDPDSSSIASVLRHRYLAALAYAQYCRESFDAAEQSLEKAQDEVRQGLERYPFLMPIANRCSDFRLQRIRISRSQRRWQEMAERIETVRRMLRDEEPLCIFSDGTPVHFATLIRFYESIPSLSEEERAAIRTVYDPELRLRQFERLAQTLYVLPGFAIGYP